jgi:hypothetical protein
MTCGTSSPKFKDIIVAVHGIGQQSRYSTVRSVATRLAASKTLLAGSTDPVRPVAPQPLGYFHSEVRDITTATLLDDAAFLGTTPLAATGFAEVFWADIPEKVVAEGSTLEETKAWGRTVVARAQALWIRECQPEAVKKVSIQGETSAWRRNIVASTHTLLMRVRHPRLIPPDFGLAAEVLDEIIETVYVLENLLFLADKAGLFKFDLAKVLQDYLGDVQIVTEFTDYRTDIVARFHKAMADIYAEECRKGNDQVRLHIVAHSEGTVISFLGLLQAMSGYQLITPTSPNDRPQLENTGQIPEWLKHVHGYMTIGSPIDKHLLLWPRLFNKLNPSLADTVLPADQIRWRNYYDYGDPIGFKLDTARRWLDQQESKAFQFCGCPAHQHDIGFARYLLPGKAHNDYWNDPGVFEHFVDDVIRMPRLGDPPANRPTDKNAIRLLSPALPYVFSAAVLIAGVYLICKAVAHFAYPDDPLTKYFLITAINMEPTTGMSRWGVFCTTLGISGLIAGVTLMARFPRLAAGRRWKIAGWVAFVTGCIFYIKLVSGPSQREIGKIFICLVERLGFGSLDKAAIIDSIIATTGIGKIFIWIVERFGSGSPITADDKVIMLDTVIATTVIILMAMIVGFLGRRVTRHGTQGDEDRRQRWLFKGMRPLLVCGAFVVALIVASQLYPQDFGIDTKLTADEAKQLSLLTKDNREIIKAAGFDRTELNQLLKANPERLDKRITRVKPFLTARPPVWPVLLAASGFLYLWWLATLIFDLAFVWQRYVRRSVANQRLREWGPHGLRQLSDSPGHPEACRNPEQPPVEV